MEERKKTIKVRKGTTVKTVPERQKEDYLRNGWYVEKDYANVNPFINSLDILTLYPYFQLLK